MVVIATLCEDHASFVCMGTRRSRQALPNYYGIHREHLTFPYLSQSLLVALGRFRCGGSGSSTPNSSTDFAIVFHRLQSYPVGSRGSPLQTCDNSISRSDLSTERKTSTGPPTVEGYKYGSRV